MYLHEHTMGRKVISERVAGLEQGDPVRVESRFRGGAVHVGAAQSELPHLAPETAQLLHHALEAAEVVCGGCLLLEERGGKEAKSQSNCFFLLWR